MLRRKKFENFNDESGFNEKANTKIKKFLMFPIILCVVLVIRIGFLCRIPEGYVGIILRMEQATGEMAGPGWRLKVPLLVKLAKMETRIQDMDEITTQGELAGKETVSMTLQMKYRINSSMAVSIYKEAGLNYKDKLIPQSEVLDVVKATVAKYNIDEFASKRATIGADALEALNTRFSDRGIIFTSLAISNYNFDENMESAISAMNAAVQEQKTQAIQIQTEKERAEADKEIAVTNAEKDAEVKLKQAKAEAEAVRIKAEAEAEANQKISTSLTEELIRYNEIEKWNGSRATVITSGAVVTDVSGN